MNQLLLFAIINHSPLFLFLGKRIRAVDWQQGAVKLSKQILISYLIGFIALSTVGGLFLFNPFGGVKEAEAAWFSDDWAYRKTITFTHNAAVSTPSQVELDIDTTDAPDKIQSDCGDIRFTDASGKILPYYYDSGAGACDTASTDFDVLMPSIINGVNLIFMYYGNPGVVNGYQLSDFSDATTTPSGGAPSPGTEVKGPSPVLYWRFDEAQGSTAEDATSNNLDGTLNNTPSWQTEDMCISGKCLFFDGANNEHVSLADNDKVDFNTGVNFTVSAWIKKTGAASANSVILQKSSANIGSTYTGYKLYMDATGDLCFDIQDGTDAVDSACTSGVDFDDDSWHFVSGVKNEDLSITLYIDGVERAQDASLSSEENLSNASALRIGVDSDGTSNDFLGYIDEVKVFRDNTARTAAQVQSDYNSRSNPQGTSTVLGANTQNNSAALSNGLVGYWKMDEASWINDCSTTSVADSSGNGNNGTACPDSTGLTGGATGKFGNAGLLDGNDDRISVADSNSLDIGTNNLTMSVWFKRTGNANFGDGFGLMEKKGGTAASTGYRLALSNQGNCAATDGSASSKTLCFIVGDNTNYQVLQTSSTYSADSIWHHVVVVFDRNNSSNNSIYVDGSKQSITLTPAAAPLGSLASINAFCLGHHGCTGTIGGFNGSLDEGRVYNRALSPAEVSQLYTWAPGPVGYWDFEAGTGTSVVDKSGNSNTGSWQGTLGSQWVNGKFGKGGNFNGSDNYVSFADSTSLNVTRFTISSWINYSETSAYQYTIEQGSPNYYLYYDGSQFIYGFNNGSSNVDHTYAFALTTNRWYHQAVTYDGATIKLYIDGILVDSESETGTPNTSGTTDGRIGADNPVDSCCVFKGKIDEFKIYNYPRTQAQIIEDMNGGHPAPGSPVSSSVAHWKLDEGYGTSAQDYSGNSNTLTLSSATAAWTNSGKFNKAWNGNGTLYLSKSDDSDFDVSATDDYSVSLWYKSDNASNPGAIEYLFNKANATTAGYAIYANTSGNLCFGIDDDTTWSPDVASCTSTDVYDGNWHHIVAVRNVTLDTIYIYVDGNLADSDADSTSATLENSLSLYVGDRDGTDNGDEFNGDLDEIKVYRSALTAEQIKLDMNRSSSQVLGAVGTSSNQQPQSAANEYCPPDSSSTSCTGPVLEYKLDEGSGTNANDSTGNANTGTITAGTGGFANGKINKAYNFDGADSVINGGSGTTLDDMAGITLEAWIYPKTTGEGSNAFIINKNLGNSQSAGWIFHYTSNQGLLFVVDGSTDLVRQSSNSVVPLNRWSHVALTWGGNITSASTVRIFVNGVETSYQTTTNGASRVSDAARSLYVGNASSSDRTFNGLIDQVRIFNYARTINQIAWSYNKGLPIGHWRMDECQGTNLYDASGNSLTGTLTGATAGTCQTSGAWFNGVTGKRNYSLDFDGTDDVVTVTNASAIDFDTGLSQGVSFSAWVYANSDGENDVGEIFKKGTGTFCRIDSEAGGLDLQCGINLATTDPDENIADAFQVNSWNHIVMTYTDDGDDDMEIYINGILRDTGDGSGAPAGTDTANLLIGGDTTANFDGLIDDFRVYNYGLTATQVKTLFNEGVTRFGPSTGAP